MTLRSSSSISNTLNANVHNGANWIDIYYLSPACLSGRLHLFLLFESRRSPLDVFSLSTSLLLWSNLTLTHECENRNFNIDTDLIYLCDNHSFLWIFSVSQHRLINKTSISKIKWQTTNKKMFKMFIWVADRQFFSTNYYVCCIDNIVIEKRMAKMMGIMQHCLRVVKLVNGIEPINFDCLLFCRSLRVFTVYNFHACVLMIFFCFGNCSVNPTGCHIKMQIVTK